MQADGRSNAAAAGRRTKYSDCSKTGEKQLRTVCHSNVQAVNNPHLRTADRLPYRATAGPPGRPDVSPSFNPPVYHVYRLYTPELFLHADLYSC